MVSREIMWKTPAHAKTNPQNSSLFLVETEIKNSVAVALLVVEGSGEVHAGAESERIRIEHWLILAQQLVVVAESPGSVAARGIKARDALRARGYRLWGKPVGGIDGPIVVLVDQVGLCIVFLFWQSQQAARYNGEKQPNIPS